MSKIKELREEAKRIETEARSKLDEANGSGVTEARSAELEGEFDSLMDKRDNLVAKADRMERSERSGREMEEIEERAARENREERRSTGASDQFTPGAGAADEYREHFREFLASGGDMSSISSEARDALRGGFVEGRAQSGATGASGGFTVPTTLAGFINAAMAAHGPMWDGEVASELVTAAGETMTIPGVDDTAEEVAAHTAGDDLADDDSGDVNLTKTDLSAFTRSSPWIKWAFELAQDSSFSWEQLLGRLIGERVGRTANRLLTVGSGSGEPLGFVSASAKGFDATAAAAITFDEILELEHSVDPAYRTGPRVGFQMHDQTVKALRKIKDNEGNYIWSDGRHAGRPGEPAWPLCAVQSGDGSDRRECQVDRVWRFRSILRAQGRLADDRRRSREILAEYRDCRCCPFRRRARSGRDDQAPPAPGHLIRRSGLMIGRARARPVF